jgi:hypothetical protein
MGTRGSFPGGKAPGAWSWPLASIQCWGQRMSGAMPLLPQYVFMALCSVKKHRDNFTFKKHNLMLCQTDHYVTCKNKIMFLCIKSIYVQIRIPTLKKANKIGKYYAKPTSDNLHPRGEIEAWSTCSIYCDEIQRTLRFAMSLAHSILKQSPKKSITI